MKLSILKPNTQPDCHNPNLEPLQFLARVIISPRSQLQPKSLPLFSFTLQLHKATAVREMALAEFEIIATCDNKSGIALNGRQPWRAPSAASRFDELTAGSGRNVLIMGRGAFEAMPAEVRPLPGRQTIVVSSKMPTSTEYVVVRSFRSALEHCAMLRNHYDRIFVVGGGKIFHQAAVTWRHLCTTLHLLKLKIDYRCDQFFPLDSFRGKGYPVAEQITSEFVYSVIKVKHTHPECMYLDLLREAIEHGEECNRERTGVGTRRLTARTLRFDLSKTAAGDPSSQAKAEAIFPLLTTKRVNFSHIAAELLWFIAGETSAKVLERLGTKIWNANTSLDALAGRGLHGYTEGQAGPIYGWQWRRFGAPWDPLRDGIEGTDVDPVGFVHVDEDEDAADEGTDVGDAEDDHEEAEAEEDEAVEEDEDEPEEEEEPELEEDVAEVAPSAEGIDQLAAVIDSIIRDPHSRRHLVTAWNPNQLDQMALPPCHFAFQFMVSGDGRFLDIVVTMRSADLFLGVPYNIASYSLLLLAVAHITRLHPREVVLNMGDCHVYETHIPQAQKQLERTPLPFPRVVFRRPSALTDIDDFAMESFELRGYQAHGRLAAEMAV